MNLAERIKNILLAPKAEWPRIDAEPSTAQSIYTGYVMVLAAIAPLLAIVLTLGAAAAAAIGQYLLSLAMTFVLAYVADALAPSFGGGKDFIRSLKLVAYSWTAVWVMAGLAVVIPRVAPLLTLAAMIYALYTFHVGAPVLGRASREKATGYTIVVALCAFAFAIIVASLLMPTLFGTSMMGGGRTWI